MIFFWAYSLRSITDGIPFVQLRIPYISEEQFIPFVLYGVILWGIIFWTRWLYRSRHFMTISDEIVAVLTSAFYWFIFYISFVYLTTGFIFSKEIPRWIIIYVYVFSSILSGVLRIILSWVWWKFTEYNILKKETILIIWDVWEYREHKNLYELLTLGPEKINEISLLIRERKIHAIISSIRWAEWMEAEKNIIHLARIYGISYLYPKHLTWVDRLVRKEVIIDGTPMIELSSLSIGIWERTLKRCIDILASTIGLILLSPLFMIMGILIKIEDSSGPVFFANRRIGKNGREFLLYKFRYMYWKYSVKDAYGVKSEDDEALKFEETLKEKNDTRNGPLYKIANDPRIMHFWKIMEKLSLDELPQLYNVLKGDMSLIWPRPHQPREVDLYDEEDTQVLIVRPGITGMAQVYGREKNSFKEEIMLDRYYIENYSLFLDLVIFFRTFIVVLIRSLNKK